MKRLSGVIQNYAWGSRHLLASLRGLESSDLPEAEIWYGAHAGAPSVLDDGSTLLFRIEQQPSKLLGAEVAREFNGRLPFLLKLLAADQPLSVQAHPTREQAKSGFAAENDAGIELGDPKRTYRDDWPKPELLAALTRFEAMLGFRDVQQSLDLVRVLGVADLGEILRAHGLAAAVEWALASPPGERAVVLAATDQLVQGATSYRGSRWAGEADMLRRISELHSGDPGLLVAALLNRVVLDPGEAVYLDAGILHAHVGGLGVEIMANSDNVVRGGLTQKNVDTSKLLEILRDAPTEVEILRPEADGVYWTPSPEFVLTSVIGASGSLAGPAIVLCVAGTVTVRDTGHELTLSPTEAAWITATEQVSVLAQGHAFVARPRRDQDRRSK